MTPLIFQRKLSQFIGLVNYYCNMWARRSHTLSPLTSITSIKVKFELTEVEQEAFEDIK